LRGSDL